MKKLLLSTLLIGMPLILFSQKDIDSIPTNKIISLTIAREIVKELTRFDSVQVELDIANDLILKSNEKSILKDSIISIYKEKEIRYLDFIKNQDKKYELLESSKKYLEDSVKRERTKNNINQIFIGLSILGLTYSIIFK
jgi:hypothetical protein